MINVQLDIYLQEIKYNKVIDLYSNEKSNVPIYSSKLNMKMDNVKFKYGLSLVNALGSEKIRCLDLGTGRGVFLNIAKKLGWQECYGVDANKNWSKIFTEKKRYHFNRLYLGKFE